MEHRAQEHEIDLEAPDRHRIVDTDIPRRVHGQIAIHRDIEDPAALLCLSELLAPIEAANRSLEGQKYSCSISASPASSL